MITLFQSKLIFFPGKLAADYRFTVPAAEEHFISTRDGETINALFFQRSDAAVILYFHGNAGDLSSWQHVADDFTSHGYSFLIIDYRGYGKSSGKITEKGLYNDAEAAYWFLRNEKKFSGQQIIVYGRSIGSGIAVDLASRVDVQGLVLEAAYSSLTKLAQEKAPFLIPSWWLKFRFNNLVKIDSVKCPALFIHGSNDSLIPPSHSQALFNRFMGKKEIAIIDGGSHNDLDSFGEYHQVLKNVLPRLFWV